MKYLSFITALILLATLFSFVFTQLNKDETKHEYGIAFPLEESESRLPPLSSVIQSEADAKSSASVPTETEATTTTETIATSAKTSSPVDSDQSTSPDGTSSMESIKPEQLEPTSESGDGGSIVIEAIQDSIVTPNDKDKSDAKNDTDSESGKDSSSEDDSSLPATNPKLVFIERLMGLNFQRAPNANGFSSFLEVRDSLAGQDGQDQKNETIIKPVSVVENSSAEEQDGAAKDQESLPWGNSLDSLRSRWENRIRKFTFPFQNSYSVVLRASSVGANDQSDKDNQGAASDNSDSSADSESELKKNLLGAPQAQEGPNKYYFQPSSPLAPNKDQNNQGQANQMLRMAALSMMSKLFSALRNQGEINQMYSNPKLDSASNRFAADHSGHDSHELDLDDDEESDSSDPIDSERSIPEGLPVPIIIAARPRPAEPYGYGGEQEMPAMHRTAIMYGRPAPAAAYQRGGPFAMAGPAVTRFGRRVVDAEPQPQRLILLISRPSAETSSPRVQIVSPQRDEQPSYPQPMFQYAPLQPPQSPVYYQSKRQGPTPIQRMIAQAIQQAQIQAQQQQIQQQQPQSQATRVVEVPVPVYVPMMVGGGGPHPRPSRVQMAPRFMSQEPSSPLSAAGQSGPGHVAVVYVHNSGDQDSQESGPQSYAQPQESEAEPQLPMGGVIRFMLRGMPRQSMAGPIGPSPIARMAFHRRLDEQDQEHDAQPSPMINHDMIDGPRLRQWRDYSQFVRSAPAPAAQQPAPVAHLLIATRSEDHEAASSEEHYQPQQPSSSAAYQAPHPFFMAQHHQQQEQSAPEPQHFMAPHPFAQNQQQGPSSPSGPHAAFFIVAHEPHGAQQEQQGGVSAQEA